MKKILKQNVLVILMHKPSVEAQLDAIINDFEFKKIIIVIQTDSGRIDQGTIEKWGAVVNFSGEVEYKLINFDIVTKKYLKKFLSECGEFTHVALPMFVNSSYWMNVSWLKKFATVISISDGSIENTTIEDLVLRMKIKKYSIKDAIKIGVMPTVMRLIGMSDICYHPYWPYYGSCLAKKSKSAGKYSLSEKKKTKLKEIISLHRPKALVIPGYEHSLESLLLRIGDVSWISTSKGKTLISNGVTYEFEEYLCAEELLTEFEPEYVIGYASDAIAIAKKMYPNIKCISVESHEICKHWGIGYNKSYKNQTSKLNISHVK